MKFLSLGHYEGHQRGIASNHADPRHWFVRFGKSMDTFRADVKKELGGSPPQSVWPDVLTDGFYRVRRSWNEASTQKGAFRVLAYAKNCADANKGYFVYSNNGTLIYKGKQT